MENGIYTGEAKKVRFIIAEIPERQKSPEWQRANALIQEQQALIVRRDAEQTEAFLRAHIELVNTHVLCIYPTALFSLVTGQTMTCARKALLPAEIAGRDITFEQAIEAGHPIVRIPLWSTPPNSPPFTSDLRSG